MGFPPVNSKKYEVNVKGPMPWWQWAIIGALVIGGIAATGYLISSIRKKK